MRETSSQYQDYREIILKEDSVEYEKWKNGTNNLYKTLVYELSKFGHVEKYACVKNDFVRYCPDYENKYATADIMNGWWYPFKYIFNLKNREEKGKIQEIMNDFDGKSEEQIINEYPDKKETIQALLDFLKVVYTAGNITPAPINPRADALDSWEYKLETYKGLYHDYKGDRDILLFREYKAKNWTTSDFKEKPSEYLKSRIVLINNRNKMIFEGQDT